MGVLITLTGMSGSGKSDVFEYVRQNGSPIMTMPSYTSRPQRDSDPPGSYIYKDKYFMMNELEQLVEYAHFPPGKPVDHPDVHISGKHADQFDGWDYLTIFDEQGLRTMWKKEDADQLFGYDVYAVFVHCDPDLRLERMGGDEKALKRFDRDKTRQLIPFLDYDLIIDNNGTKKELYMQVDNLLNKFR